MASSWPSVSPMPRSATPPPPQRTGIWNPLADARQRVLENYLSLKTVRYVLGADWTDKEEAQYLAAEKAFNFAFPGAEPPSVSFLSSSSGLDTPGPSTAATGSSSVDPQPTRPVPHGQLFRNYLLRNGTGRAVDYQEAHSPRYLARLTSAGGPSSTAPAAAAAAAQHLSAFEQWRQWEDCAQCATEAWIHAQQSSQHDPGFDNSIDNVDTDMDMDMDMATPSSSFDSLGSYTAGGLWKPHATAAGSSISSSSFATTNPTGTYIPGGLWVPNNTPVASFADAIPPRMPSPIPWELGGAYGSARDLEDSPEDWRWAPRFWADALAEIDVREAERAVRGRGR